jgi:multiple sugar transport system substrate-binding protein
MSHAKVIARVIGVAVLLALVVSCAPAATPAPEPTTPPATTAPEPTTPTEEPTPEATEPPEPVTLKVWKYASSMANQALWVEEMIQLYMEENPHVTIVYEEFPFATYGSEALPTAFAAGEPPDVFWGTNTHIREFYEEGVLLPLDDYLSDEFIEDCLPEVLDSVTYDGKIYSLPFEVDITGIGYRSDLWEEAGLTEEDIPETWDELIDVATRLTTEERYGIYLAPSATEHSVWQFVSWVWMGGGDFVDKELTTVLYDSQATVDALKLWGDMMNEYQCMVPTALGIGEAMGTGKAVMEFCASAHVGVFDQAYPEMKDTMRVFWLPLPDGEAKADNYIVYGGFRLGVSNRGENPEEAAKLAAWLVAEDPARPAKWCTWARPTMSPRASVRATPEYQAMLEDPRMAAFEPFLPYGRTQLDAPAEIANAVIESMQGVLYGGVSPEDATSAAAAQMEAYIESR